MPYWLGQACSLSATPCISDVHQYQSLEDNSPCDLCLLQLSDLLVICNPEILLESVLWLSGLLSIVTSQVLCWSGLVAGHVPSTRLRLYGQTGQNFVASYCFDSRRKRGSARIQAFNKGKPSMPYLLHKQQPVFGKCVSINLTQSHVYTVRHHLYGSTNFSLLPCYLCFQAWSCQISFVWFM